MRGACGPGRRFQPDAVRRGEDIVEEDIAERTHLVGKALLLLYAAIAVNIAAATGAAVLSVQTGSVALVAFALVLFVDAAPQALLALRFREEQSGRSAEDAHSVVERNLFFGLGVMFFLVALYIVSDAGSRLFYHERPISVTESAALAGGALAVLVVLAVVKHRSARELESELMRARASETAATAVLAGLLVLGAAARMLFEWWWADPVSALLMAPCILKRGWKAMEESKAGQPVSTRSARADV